MIFFQFPIVIMGSKVDLNESRECDHSNVIKWADSEKGMILYCFQLSVPRAMSISSYPFVFYISTRERHERMPQISILRQNSRLDAFRGGACNPIQSMFFAHLKRNRYVTPNAQYKVFLNESDTTSFVAQHSLYEIEAILMEFSCFFNACH